MLRARIAVLVSGGGTNLQALIDAQKSGVIKSGELSLVISNNPNALALERAKAAGIESAVLTRKELGSQEAFEDAMISMLDAKSIDLIVLAGFMSILSEKFTRHFENRIINVHPSLIPSFCGKGFYGLKVHEEALKKGVKVTVFGRSIPETSPENISYMRFNLLSDDFAVFENYGSVTAKSTVGKELSDSFGV